MSKVIPKEHLTAYQRWELAAFDEGFESTSPMHLQAPNVAPVPPAPAEQHVVLPTAEDLERLHQEAWQDGYQLGLEEGRKAGLASGQAESDRYLAELSSLVRCLSDGQLHQDQEIASEVLQLSLVMARQILRSALNIRPELILDAISEALKTLPTLNGHHKIVTHPDSARIVRDWLTREHSHLSWKVFEDTQMEPGDFRFESAYSELDGRMRSRWIEMSNCLGADESWLI